jgi:hypothetical protein
MKIQKLVAMNKFIFNRGYSYIGTLGIGFVVASQLQTHSPFDKIPIYILFPLGTLGIWILGIMDVKFKFLEEEQKYATKKNPFSYVNLKDET